MKYCKKACENLVILSVEWMPLQAIMKDLEAAGWKKAVEKKKDEITELDIKVIEQKGGSSTLQ